MLIIEDYINEYGKNYGYDFGPKEIISYINIHFVWSIWNDTPKKHTDSVLSLGFQIFITLPKDEMTKQVKKGEFSCNGNCGY